MFNKRSKESQMQVQTKTGIIHKGNYGSLYNVETGQIMETRVKTGKRGRPAKVDAPAFISNVTNDLFGRVPLAAPKGNQGRVVIGKASANAVYANDCDE
jgi:hypothetical protein